MVPVGRSEYGAADEGLSEVLGMDETGTTGARLCEMLGVDETPEGPVIVEASVPAEVLAGCKLKEADPELIGTTAVVGVAGVE